MARRASRADRAAGEALRRALAARPAAARAAASASRGMSPAFRALVAALVLAPRTRPAGLRALASAVAASLVAGALRRRIGRRRPGARTEGGLPSKHAAASAAIAASVGRTHPAAGAALWPVVAVGLAGRVQTRDHDPADLVAGVAAGWAVARAVGAFARIALPERRGTR